VSCPAWPWPLGVQENFSDSNSSSTLNLEDINQFVDNWEKVDITAVKASCHLLWQCAEAVC
jgi:hypothetical protein